MDSETSSIVMVNGTKDHVEDDPVVIVGMGMFPPLSPFPIPSPRSPPSFPVIQ